MLDVEELRDKLEAHPDHAGCCPVCRRATAETWAALQAITEAVGSMMRGGGRRGMLAGLAAMIRGRGGYVEPIPDEGPRPHRPGPAFAGEDFPPPLGGAENHPHPELGWEEDYTHAHLESDRRHTHGPQGVVYLDDEP